MKIPKQKVFYIPCLHNMGEGDTFQLEGGHYHTHQEALKEVNQMQYRHPHELFVAEVTVKRANLTTTTTSKRKGA